MSKGFVRMIDLAGWCRVTADDNSESRVVFEGRFAKSALPALKAAMRNKSEVELVRFDGLTLVETKWPEK